MFGCSYPEAQIATRMSYDTGIQNILQETLEKLIVEACRKLMRSSRLFNWDLNVVYPMTTFLVVRRTWEDITANGFSDKYELGLPHLEICQEIGASRKSP